MYTRKAFAFMELAVINSELDFVFVNIIRGKFSTTGDRYRIRFGIPSHQGQAVIYLKGTF
jgi:hypothetical protein